jgi:nucleoid DNA-binding protein
MIKSQLILRIAAQNPHLPNSAVEKVVNTIFDEIAEATSPLDKRTAGQSVHLPRWIFNTQSVGTIVLFQYLER